MRAIGACSNAAGLARRLRVTPQAIAQWNKVPVDRVREVAAITKIPPHELRPDLAAIFGEVA